MLDEIWINILYHSSVDDLISNLSCICKQVYSLINTHIFWSNYLKKHRSYHGNRSRDYYFCCFHNAHLIDFEHLYYNHFNERIDRKNDCFHKLDYKHNHICKECKELPQYSLIRQTKEFYKYILVIPNKRLKKYKIPNLKGEKDFYGKKYKMYGHDYYIYKQDYDELKVKLIIKNIEENISYNKFLARKVEMKKYLPKSLWEKKLVKLYLKQNKGDIEDIGIYLRKKYHWYPGVLV